MLATRLLTLSKRGLLLGSSELNLVCRPLWRYIVYRCDIFTRCICWKRFARIQGWSRNERIIQMPRSSGCGSTYWRCVCGWCWEPLNPQNNVTRYIPLIYFVPNTTYFSPGVVSTIAGSGSLGSTDGIGITASFDFTEKTAIWCCARAQLLLVCDGNKLRQVTIHNGNISR